MLDVARVAQVSIATVSAFVNGSANVSPAATQRIEGAIRTVGYQRNAVARSLKLGRTHTVGLTVPHITNPFFTEVVSVITQAFDRAGYAVMLFCTDEHLSNQDEQIRLLLERMVDGLIVARVGEDERFRSIVGATKAPFVLIDRLCEGVDADAVVLDNRTAVAEAVGYLTGLGHRRIAYVAGGTGISTMQERAAGYRAALEEAGLAFDPALVRLGDFHEMDGYAAAMQLMTLPDRPTAVFSANNPMVVGVMKALRDLGLNCPKDVSVACFDDFPFADVFHPQMTTVRQPVQAIGEQATALLLERIAGTAASEPRRLTLRGRLMIRGSCAPPSGWAAQSA
ncbi:LacI family transcriptional regulator [Mesorhizobium sp. RP14(2022)]|uniref:LacI family transcriptional regulator n=1 Tax=Mesorhizobium liriopis TaxID=2953882 RepID=A0ABT1CC01_9HYPH|nr:LacI family DNA-binding transcriptional regulator [Mesorhizobium liriopis]MCO6052354.1 LacI family transcriptional regulator [Mesorhizobium liriopis]